MRTLRQSITENSNDYTSLEELYRLKTTDDLVANPFRSVTSYRPPLHLTTSIVIPAWNVRDTIAKCLIAIEQSSFNHNHPDLLEVIVVDDGSKDDTWDVISHLDLDVNMIAVSQKHQSRAHAMNTGLSIAQGEVVISCDGDMILTTYAIEELVKRHQILKDVLLIGFRIDIDARDSRINIGSLKETLPYLLPEFYADNRLTYHWDGHPYPGWPENMCRASIHLKELGNGREIWLPDGDTWSLPRMVYGALFSMRRADWNLLQGFDERFYGWGWEDTAVGAGAIGLNKFIIPVYSAAGIHIRHPMRSHLQWREGKRNKQIYESILAGPEGSTIGNRLRKARERIRRIKKFPSPTFPQTLNPAAHEAMNIQLAKPGFLRNYYVSLGRFIEALGTFTPGGLNNKNGWELFHKGKIYRLLRRNTEALPVLREAAAIIKESAMPLVELGLALAAEGNFDRARSVLEQALLVEPKNGLLSYILRCPINKRIKRGRNYAAQGYHAIALCDFEAALIQDPFHQTALQSRELSLDKLNPNTLNV